MAGALSGWRSHPGRRAPSPHAPLSTAYDLHSCTLRSALCFPRRCTCNEPGTLAASTQGHTPADPVKSVPSLQKVHDEQNLRRPVLNGS